MPRITAEEARAMSEATVERLVEQAYDRIRDRAPHGTHVRLSRADDPVWSTFRKGSRERLEEAAGPRTNVIVDLAMVSSAVACDFDRAV